MLPLERRAADALMAAAIDGSPWREALLGVAHACRAQVGSLVVVDRATGQGEGFCEGVERNWARPFVEREARHVAIGARFVERGRVFTDRTALPRKVFEASGFYQQWSAPSRQTDYAGVAVVNEPGRFAFVGLSRGPMPGAFGERELQKLQAVAPYIRNAAAVWMKLGARTSVSASLESAFDAMSDGVLICDGQGRVAYANAAATQILADEDGLSAGPEGLSASGGAGERLKKFIWAAGHGGGGAVSVARPSEQAPYSVHVAPLRSNMRGPSPQGSALVVIVDPASPGVRRMEVLRDLYGLSPAERAVAAAIATGAGVKSAARDLKISPVTVRTHLERIFGKVGVRNQVQLAARIARCLPKRS